MSRKHKKNRKPTPQPVGSVTLPERKERHGRPLAEVYVKEEVVRVTRGARVNPNTGEAEIYTERKVLSPRRPMTPKEIEEARARVPRALGPTMKYGKEQSKS